MPSYDLRLERVSFRYTRGSLALNSLDLTIPASSRFAVIGPNSCGKTTLLRVIAGHLNEDEGRVWLGDRLLSGLRPQERPIATVFQDLGLFPHLTVQQNVSYGLRHKRHLGKQSASVAMEWLERFKLEALKAKYPGELSLGVQQRVAIARALALRPEILLLDEPTSSLDSLQRQRLLKLLADAEVSGWCKTLLLVTHDFDFAFAVCESAAILNEGAVVGHGAVRDLILQPQSDWIVDYLQSQNRLEGAIDGNGLFKSNCGAVTIPLHDAFPSQTGAAAILIRPDQLSLFPGTGEGARSLEVVFNRLAYRCNGASLYCSLSQNRIRCDLLARDIPAEIQIGSTIALHFDISDLRIHDKRNTRSMKAGVGAS